MRGTRSEKRSFLQIGCLSGVVVLALVVVIVGSMVAIAWKQSRDEHPESHRVEQEIPLAEADLTAESGAIGEAPLARGRIVFALSVAHATVIPGEPGSPIEIEANYDPARFEVTQETVNALDGGWTTRIAIRPRRSKFWALLQMELGSTAPVVRIRIPRDVPFDLEGTVENGFAAVELGGLSVLSSDLQVRGGGLELSFNEPLPAPMESIHVQTESGEVQISRLGNASPAVASFRTRLAGVTLDLRGSWVNDSDIEFDAKVAGGTIWLPRGARVVGLESIQGLAPIEVDPEIPRPTLNIDLVGQKRNLLVID